MSIVSEEPLETIEKEKEDLEEINKLLKQKVKELEEERELSTLIKQLTTCCMTVSKRE